MRRYKFLDKEQVFEALNRLRDSFLAAKNGDEVDEIINGLLTFDERMKIGRRIIVAEYINSGYTIEEIAHNLKVGKNTISHVAKFIDEHPDCFQLIKKRTNFVEKEFKYKISKRTGGSNLIFKPKIYTGFKRKEVKR